MGILGCRPGPPTRGHAQPHASAASRRLFAEVLSTANATFVQDNRPNILFAISDDRRRLLIPPLSASVESEAARMTYNALPGEVCLGITS